MISLCKVKRPSLLTDKHASADQLRSDYQCSKISSEDLLVEIFRRMPVKSVCCMRCVCKSWNNLISSSFFISHYHQNSSSIPPTLKSCVLFKRRPDNSYLYAFCHADHGVAFDHSTMFKSLPLEHLPFRTCDKHDHLTFLDAIHGVVCLTFSEKTSILWNPTIRKCVKIPKSPFKFGRISYAPSLGFGFNSLKYDFNLIRLWMPFHLESHDKRSALLVYEVFSAREGVWKKAVGSEIPPGEVISKTSFFMNGRIHWIVSEYKFRNQKQARGIKCYRLLMFDCERQEFTRMKLPRKFKELEEKYYDCNGLFLFKWQDMLSVMVLIVGSLYVWVMEEYGKASTWKNLHFRDEFFNLVLEESMLLMDAKRQLVSYGEKHDRNDGKVYYEIDERTCEHITI